jgi:hypothetical protein
VSKFPERLGVQVHFGDKPDLYSSECYCSVIKKLMALKDEYLGRGGRSVRSGEQLFDSVLLVRLPSYRRYRMGFEVK